LFRTLVDRTPSVPTAMASPTSEIAVGSAIIASLGIAVAAYMVFGTRPQREADSESIDPQVRGEFAETKSPLLVVT